MSDLTDALEKILNWVEKYRPSDISFLQPGLSNIEINELIADLPLQLPEDIRELYQWKNGTKIIGDYWEFSCIFEKWSFYPLQLVINGYRDKIERYQNTSKESIFEYKRLNALNIFFSYELTDTGYVIIDDKTQQTSPVIFHSCKGGDCSPIIKYASLTSMMVTIAECFENAYYVDADGYLTLDTERCLDIWRKYNSVYITETALAKLKGEPSVDLLFEIETDLIQAKHPMTVEFLLQNLQKPIVTNQDLSIQQLAIKVLGELGDSKAIAPLIYFLQDRDYLSRYHAATSLGKLRDKQATYPLIYTLRDSDSNVRCKAAWALGEIKDPLAIEALSNLLKDEDYFVRKVAQEALSKLAV